MAERHAARTPPAGPGHASGEDAREVELKLSPAQARRLLGKGTKKKSGLMQVSYEEGTAHMLWVSERPMSYGPDAAQMQNAPWSPILSPRAAEGVLKFVAAALSLPQKVLEEVSAAPSPDEVIDRLAELRKAGDQDEDPLAEFTRGAAGVKRELMSAAGGSLSSREVGRLLHMTEVGVRKRVNAGTLLAVKLGKRGLRYPRMQFTGDSVVDGLGEVLLALKENEVEEWMALRFLAYPNARLQDQVPIQVLKDEAIPPGERKEQVLDAARAFGTQGAD